MTTAADTFDLVPPWCVVKKGSRWWGIESSDGEQHGDVLTDEVLWERGPVVTGDSFCTSEPEARRIARLTSPLDSWEPPADCPLPVEGWKVVQQTFGERRWEILNSAGRLSSNCSYDTRRAAIVWAWKEGPAPTDANPRPITEADVKVGAIYPSTHPSGRVYARYIQAVKDGLVQWCPVDYDQRYNDTLASFVGWANKAGNRITDGTGATDGPPDDRGTLGWAAFDELCKTTDHSINALDDRIGAVETKVEDMADVLARVCPEADSQTDGKGRTLVEIDAAIAHESARLSNVCDMAKSGIADHGRRLRTIEDKLERLTAAKVAKTATLATRSDDASTNEVATAAAASDEGWRDQLVAYRLYDNSPPAIAWVTPDGQWMTGSFSAPTTGWWNIGKGNDLQKVWRKVEGDIPANAIKFRDSIINPPPNLAEWYKPKAAAFRDTAAVNADTLKDYDAACAAVPSTYRVGDDLAAWVRNLVKAHEKALADMAGMRTTISSLETQVEHVDDLELKVRSKTSVMEATRTALGIEPGVSVTMAAEDLVNERNKLRSQLADAQTAAVAAEGRAATAVKRASKAEEELADLRGKVENLRAAFSG